MFVEWLSVSLLLEDFWKVEVIWIQDMLLSHWRILCKYNFTMLLRALKNMYVLVNSLITYEHMIIHCIITCSGHYLNCLAKGIFCEEFVRKYSRRISDVDYHNEPNHDCSAILEDFSVSRWFSTTNYKSHYLYVTV